MLRAVARVQEQEFLLNFGRVFKQFSVIYASWNFRFYYFVEILDLFLLTLASTAWICVVTKLVRK